MFVTRKPNCLHRFKIFKCTYIYLHSLLFRAINDAIYNFWIYYLYDVCRYICYVWRDWTYTYPIVFDTYVCITSIKNRKLLRKTQEEGIYWQRFCNIIKNYVLIISRYIKCSHPISSRISQQNGYNIHISILFLVIWFVYTFIVFISASLSLSSEKM